MSAEMHFNLWSVQQNDPQREAGGGEMEQDMTHAEKRKFACATRWLVDFSDKRGERVVPAICAAMATAMGLRARLASISSSPTRPIIVPGIQYEGRATYVSDVCATCGFPTQIRKVSQ